MEFADIRRQVVIAMFSDDVLFDRLVLKGGNALALVHGVSSRGSLDIDLAMQGDFEDFSDTDRRIRRALRDRFDSVGILPFDMKFERRPRGATAGRPRTWGGYVVEFKLIEHARARRLGEDLEKMRREGHTIGPGQQRTFRIDISHHEFCSPKTAADLDGYTIYVYTPEMCVLEKLRAICQQMEEYPFTATTRRPRARDLYDIHETMERFTSIDLSAQDNLELCGQIFEAKEVPVALLGRIQYVREYHRPDWDRVRTATSGPLREYDYYFDYVIRVVLSQLKPLWIV